MELHITSLREALEEAMEAPTTTPPAVVVDSVHVAQAAALLALLRFQESRGRWKLRNAARLAELVSLDSLLRAIATELLPSLVADPTSHPALGVLSRYARYVKASASAVGGNFFDGVTTICDELIGHVAIASRRPLRLTSEALLRRTNIVLRRLQAFRSRQVLIADADHDYDGDDEDEDDSDADVLPFELRLTSLRQALQEVTAAPAADRRVTVDAVRASHSSAILGVLTFQATACSWDVCNIRRVTALVTLDACFEAIGLGLLRILNGDPTHEAALTLLHELATHINDEVGTVGGNFQQYAAAMARQLVADATTATATAPADMLEKTQQIRQDLAVFRCQVLSIATDSDSSDATTDTDASG
jgi:hypothetical protein